MVITNKIVNVGDMKVDVQIFENDNKFAQSKFVSPRSKKVFDTDEEAQAEYDKINQEMLETVHSNEIADKSKKFQNK